MERLQSHPFLLPNFYFVINIGAIHYSVKYNVFYVCSFSDIQIYIPDGHFHTETTTATNNCNNFICMYNVTMHKL